MSSKPTSGDVVGHPPAALVERLQRAQRHEVVGGDDAVEPPGRVEQRVHRPAAARHGEVGVGDRGRRQARARRARRGTRRTVDGGGHVQRPGDGADAGAARLGEQAGRPRGRRRGCRRRRSRRPRGVARRPERAALQHHRHPGVLSCRGSGSSPCSDTNATPSTWPPRANRANRSRSASSVSDAEHELHVVRGDGGVHAAQHEGEERVGEEPLLGLGHDEGDRVAAAGHQRPRRPVRDVRQLGGGAQHRVAGVVADPGDPASTRPAVARETPARAATDSRVGASPCRAVIPTSVLCGRTVRRRRALVRGRVVAGSPVTSQSPHRRRRGDRLLRRRGAALRESGAGTLSTCAAGHPQIGAAPARRAAARATVADGPSPSRAQPPPRPARRRPHGRRAARAAPARRAEHRPAGRLPPRSGAGRRRGPPPAGDPCRTAVPRGRTR